MYLLNFSLSHYLSIYQFIYLSACIRLVKDHRTFPDLFTYIVSKRYQKFPH